MKLSRAGVVALALIGALSACDHGPVDPVNGMLQYLPMDVSAVVCARPKLLLDSPLVQALLRISREQTGSGAAGVDPFEELKQKTGVDPARDVDWVAVGMSEGRTAYVVVSGRLQDVGKDAVQKEIAGAHAFVRKGAIIVDLGRGVIGVAKSEADAELMLKVKAGAAPRLSENLQLASLLRAFDPQQHGAWGAAIPPAGKSAAPAEMAGDFGRGIDKIRTISYFLDCTDSLHLALTCHTTDAAGAKQLATSVNQGLMLLRFLTSQKQELQAMLNGLTVRQDNSDVILDVAVPGETLLAAAQKNASSANRQLQDLLAPKK